MLSLSLLSKLWGLSWVRGVALSIGILVAVISWGALQKHTGYLQGRADQKVISEAAWEADAALAREVVARATAHSDSLIRALRDSQHVQAQLVARLSEAKARAEGKWAASLAAYEQLKALSGDSIPPDVRTVCDSLASSCSNAIAAAQQEKEALVMQLHTAEALAVAQSDAIAREPERWKPVVADALEQQRQAFRAPSRSKWFAIGAAAGRASCELGRGR